MKVAELRKALADIPGELDVTVRASDDDNDQWIVGGIWKVGVDYAHDENDTPFLAIEVTTDADEQPDCTECGMNVYCKPSCTAQTYLIASALTTRTGKGE